MRVMFVARAMDNMAGGVERIVITVMNGLVKRGFNVSLLTWDLEHAEAFYKMDSGIRWYRLCLGDPGKKANIGIMLRRAIAVRKYVRQERPQVIVCFQSGAFISIRLYTMGMGVPVIASERNAPTLFDHTRAGRYRNWIYQSFRFASKVLVQVEDYKSFYPSFLKKQITTIPNPVTPVERGANPAEPDVDGYFNILSVGRLSYQKNYEILIHAFAELAEQFSTWNLVIVGDGEQRGMLESLITGHHLQNRISLPGTTHDIDKYFARAHLFCLPSRWEGFPNSLAEALAHGLPAVGFSECAGVNALIEPYVNGLLAEGNGTVTTLVQRLRRLMADPGERKKMSAAAVRSVEPYKPDIVFSQWEQLLQEIIQKQNHE